MIYLYKRQGRAPLRSFKTYGEVVDFIHNSQLYRLAHVTTPAHPLVSALDLQDTAWRFVYYKHSELNLIYSCMKEPPIQGIERESFDQGLDLIEIHQGDPLNPVQIPVTQDLDIETLKKEWCKAYCQYRGYSLIKAFTNDDLSEPASLSAGGEADDLVV